MRIFAFFIVSGALAKMKQSSEILPVKQVQSVGNKFFDISDMTVKQLKSLLKTEEFAKSHKQLIKKRIKLLKNVIQRTVKKLTKQLSKKFKIFSLIAFNHRSNSYRNRL